LMLISSKIEIATLNYVFSSHMEKLMDI